MVFTADWLPRRFLGNLKLMAVDELHYYTDLFGRYPISKSNASFGTDALEVTSRKSSGGFGGSVLRLAVSICSLDDRDSKGVHGDKIETLYSCLAVRRSQNQHST